MRDILDTLADGRTAALASILGAALSRYMDDEVHIHSFYVAIISLMKFQNTFIVKDINSKTKLNE